MHINFLPAFATCGSTARMLSGWESTPARHPAGCCEHNYACLTPFRPLAILRPYTGGTLFHSIEHSGQHSGIEEAACDTVNPWTERKLYRSSNVLPAFCGLLEARDCSVSQTLPVLQ